MTDKAMAALKARLAAQAAAEGLAAFGVMRPAEASLAGERLRDWLDQGRHGSMGYMADRATWRADPAALWPEAQAVVMVAEEYGPAENPLGLLAHRDRGAVSVYARGRDYHDVLKKKLKRLARFLVAEAGGPERVAVKVFVDTAPVMEKPLAQAAGLGWIGKHTNLVGRKLGSWFFLGAVFTTVPLPPDQAETDHCGACRRCLDICPTAAFPAPYQLDARRCVSYLTIELKTPIPRDMRPLIGNRIYGCDDCLAVCPWNKFARTAHDSSYHARAELKAPRLTDLATLDDAGFRTVFSGSPLKRIGRDRFVRNVLIALGNSGDARSVTAVSALLDDPSPLVRGAAVWALSRLSPNGFRAARRVREALETDPDVSLEWRALA